MAGLKRRKRTKIDHDVIRTEPDHRRASGAGDDDDDVEDEAVSRTPKYEPVYTTRDDVIHRRRWTARKSKTQELRFPFFSLPAEIRNMVYRCLVVSQRDEPIDLTADGNKRFPSGKIETAILFANKQTFQEASSILYGNNRFLARVGSFAKGIDLRFDKEKTVSATSMSLRNGRTIDRIEHTGLVYPHIALKLQNLELRVTLSDHMHCIHMKDYTLTVVQMYLEEHVMLIDKFVQQGHVTDNVDKSSGLGSSARWTLRVKSCGGLTLEDISHTLGYLGASKGDIMMAHDNLRVELDGKFPKHIKRAFHRMGKGTNFVTARATKDDTPGAWAGGEWPVGYLDQHDMEYDMWVYLNAHH